MKQLAIKTAVRTADRETSVAEAKWLLGPVLALYPLLMLIAMLGA